MAKSNGGGRATYAGSIKNTGVQTVKAPFQQGTSGGKTIVKTGGDLRSK